jgi:hypothetical protein
MELPANLTGLIVSRHRYPSPALLDGASPGLRLIALGNRDDHAATIEDALQTFARYVRSSTSGLGRTAFVESGGQMSARGPISAIFPPE